jgi:hypothetical protein
MFQLNNQFDSKIDQTHKRFDDRNELYVSLVFISFSNRSWSLNAVLIISSCSSLSVGRDSQSYHLAFIDSAAILYSNAFFLSFV